MNCRIAAVQHGDFVEASQIIARGDPEPYFGMANSLEVLRGLFAGSPHLVISLNSPRYRMVEGSGTRVGLPSPSLPRFLPRTIAAEWWGRQIVGELRRFEPTHVLLRTGGVVARRVLEYCTHRSLNTAAIFANQFEPSGRRARALTRSIVRMLNLPCVRLIGNHKQPATDSMLACGVDPAKSFAYDWPNARHPKDSPIKTLRVGEGARILYVGSMSMPKGVGDLVDAMEILSRAGRQVRLTALGDGPDLAALRARASALPDGVVEFPGRVSNDVAFRHMIDCTVVCVPSRHMFSEGMPLTLTEALASRTPVVISDHPVLARAFVEGEGVRFFPERDARALADTLWTVLSDEAGYEGLSRSTMAAFARVECRTSLGDLVARWRETF